MTDDEKRQQKAMLLLEFQEAREECAHQRERLSHFADDLASVAQLLRDALEQSNFNIRNAQSRLATPESIPAPAEILKALKEASAACDKAAELAKRKESLGLV